MTKNKNSFLKQIRNNSVALISLFIAISSLAYNTWRNEQTEQNRNQRYAAFQVLIKLNELQQVIFYNFYDKDSIDKGNPRTGWAYVLSIQDFSSLLHQPLPESSDKLQDIWAQNWQFISTDEKKVKAIIAAIDILRDDTLTLLKSLDESLEIQFFPF